MRAPISVVIPTLNCENTLPDCLNSLMEGLEFGLIRELIVSDGGSSDTTGAVAQAWGARVVHGAASRGGQLRRGCAVAKGDWLLVLHADTQLEPGWPKAVQAHIRQSDRPAWFYLRFDQAGIAAWLVAQWANIRSGFWHLPYGDQGLLIPRRTYLAIGGYADVPLMEDVALVRKLRGSLIGLRVTAVTSAAKYRSQGWLRRGARNLWTLMGYLAGRDVASLEREYRR
ncbi:MAG: TIGR04283 family arsenosugar biosynthesis glycosyltransferase [Pseudomonadota bacterium]